MRKNWYWKKERKREYVGYVEKNLRLGDMFAKNARVKKQKEIGKKK